MRWIGVYRYKVRACVRAQAPTPWEILYCFTCFTYFTCFTCFTCFTWQRQRQRQRQRQPQRQGPGVCSSLCLVGHAACSARKAATRVMCFLAMEAP